MKLNIFHRRKIDNNTKLVRAMELKEAARLIRIHYKTLFAIEPKAPIISEIFECCAQILEQIDEKKIRYERYGQWIKHHTYRDTEGDICEIFQCSNCGQLGEDTNYCPNCGASMKGELSDVDGKIRK